MSNEIALRNTVIGLRDSARKCAESLEHSELPDPADIHKLIHAIQDSEKVVPSLGLETTLRHGHDHAHADHPAHHHPHDHAHEPSSCAERTDGPSGTEHEHGMTPDEQKIIEHFIWLTKNPPVDTEWNIRVQQIRALIKVINGVADLADLFEHNEDFQKACQVVLVKVVVGAYASCKYSHAYVLGKTPDCFSIWSAYDFDKIDESAFPWRSHDLFQKDYE